MKPKLFMTAWAKQQTKTFNNYFRIQLLSEAHHIIRQFGSDSLLWGIALEYELEKLLGSR
jgi:hypothetical protein